MTPFNNVALWVAFVILCVCLLALAGCEPQEPHPRLQTYGAYNNPICVLFCDTVIEAANGEGDGSVATGSVSVTHTPSASQANQNSASVAVQ